MEKRWEHLRHCESEWLLWSRTISDGSWNLKFCYFHHALTISKICRLCFSPFPLSFPVYWCWGNEIVKNWARQTKEKNPGWLIHVGVINSLVIRSQHFVMGSYNLSLEEWNLNRLVNGPSSLYVWCFLGAISA